MKGIGDDSFKLPGELFDVNTQCQLEYGDEMRVCSYMVCLLIKLVAFNNYGNFQDDVSEFVVYT